MRRAPTHRSPDVGWSACGDSTVPGGISADERFCRSEGYEYPSEKWSLLVFSGRYCPGNFHRDTGRDGWNGCFREFIWTQAHNAGGIEALHETMTRMQKGHGKSIPSYSGAVADKEHKKMIQNLCQDLTITHVTIAHMETSRCADTEQLKGEVRGGFELSGGGIPDGRRRLEAFPGKSGRRTGVLCRIVVPDRRVKSLLKTQRRQKMIDFEEELSRFKPSLEIEVVEGYHCKE